MRHVAEPLVIFLALATQRRFPLSTLLLVLLWWHAVVLIVGGHYTYARVPLGDTPIPPHSPLPTDLIRSPDCAFQI